MRSRAPDGARHSPPTITAPSTLMDSAAALPDDGQPADWIELGQRVLSEALRRAVDDFDHGGGRRAGPNEHRARRGGHS